MIWMVLMTLYSAFLCVLVQPQVLFRTRLLSAHHPTSHFIPACHLVPTRDEAHHGGVVSMVWVGADTGYIDRNHF